MGISFTGIGIGPGAEAAIAMGAVCKFGITADWIFIGEAGTSTGGSIFATVGAGAAIATGLVSTADCAKLRRPKE